MSESFILLHPDDNVVVARESVRKASAHAVAGETLILDEDVPLGHKVARRPISKGATILKYGMSIGSATRAIAAGAWVHLHNMRSDYIGAHTRQIEDEA